MLPRLRRWLDVPSWRERLALLAVLLSLPSAIIGLQADDYVLAGLVQDGWWRAFSFTPDRAARDAAVASGDLGWASSPDYVQAFFRPIASLSHALDFALFPGAPWVMHLENVALYALVVWLAASVLEALLEDRWTAALATLLYAVNGNQSVTVGWVSGRNTLLAAAFGLAAIALHLRSSTERRPLLGLGALGALAAALASGELGLSVLAVLVAHAVLVDDRGRRAALTALAPAMALGVAYIGLRSALGFGAHGSGYYFDVGDPRELARGIAIAVPTYVVSQLTVCYASFGLFSPGGLVFFSALSLALALVIVPWLWPVLRSPRGRFFAATAVLSAVVLGGSVPQDRVVFFVALGTTGLLALRFTTPDERRWGHATSGLVLGAHAPFALLVFVPMSLAAAGPGIGGSGRALETALPTAPTPVIVLHAPNELVTSWARAERRAHGTPTPSTVRVLYAGGDTLEVVSVEERAVTLRVARGWLATSFERVTSNRADFRVGERIGAGETTAEIVEITSDGRPRTVRFELDQPWSEVTVLRWVDGRVEPAAPRAGDAYTALSPI